MCCVVKQAAGDPDAVFGDIAQGQFHFLICDPGAQNQS